MRETTHAWYFTEPLEVIASMSMLLVIASMPFEMFQYKFSRCTLYSTEKKNILALETKYRALHNACIVLHIIILD